MVDEVTKNIEMVSKRLVHFEEAIPKEQFANVPEKEAEEKGFFLRDFGMNQWDWPQGVGIFGLHLEGEKNNTFIKKWADSEIEKGLPTKNINTICPMLTLMDFPEYEDLALEWMEWVENECSRTKENGLEHITSGKDKFSVKENPEQIWVDTLFMTILFMAKMGVKYDNKNWREDALYQVLLHSKYLLDRETGLFYHGWEFGERGNFNGVFWCRGNSWFTVGLPLFLSIMQDYISAPIKNHLQNLYNNQVFAILKLKEPGKLWHTVLDDSESYIETSGSAGILAGIILGVKLGMLDNIISKEKITQWIRELEEEIDETGVVQNVSAGTPISEEKENYKEIIKIPMVYGQSMMLLALTAYRNYACGGNIQ